MNRTNPINISETESALIKSILSKHLPPNTRVWVFGSRAKGTARYNSDLDLAFESTHEIDAKVLAKMKADFEEAPLPFFIDIIDLKQTHEPFKMIVNKEKVYFFLKN